MKFWEAMKLLDEGRTVKTRWGYTHNLQDYESLGLLVANDLTEEEIDGEWSEVLATDRICKTCFHFRGCLILDAIVNKFVEAEPGNSCCSGWEKCEEKNDAEK